MKYANILGIATILLTFTAVFGLDSMAWRIVCGAGAFAAGAAATAALWGGE